VSKSNLKFNYNYLSSLNPKIKIAPVLKSNAYGHGIVHVAKILQRFNPPFLCVYSFQEALELVKNGIESKILIFGHIHPDNLLIPNLNFSYAVYNEKFLDLLYRRQPNAGIHIFVDTGMHREGINLKNLPKLLFLARKMPELKIEGLMSHLGWADKPGHAHTSLQVQKFTKAKELLKDFGFFPQWIHIANSSGLLNHKKYDHNLGNMARVGLALYGIDPEDKDQNLKPVLQLKTTLAQTKRLPKGGKVGYNFTFTAKKEMKIGIIPMGYFDGIDRRLSNIGFVYIKGVACQIVGRISMNMTTIDITHIKNAVVGTEVTVFSNKLEHKNTVAKIAKICKTIPYELIAPLAHTIERRIID
jgi:alanine racemase